MMQWLDGGPPESGLPLFALAWISRHSNTHSAAFTASFFLPG